MFKAVATKITLLAIDTSTNTPKTGDAANITAYVAKDGGSVTVLTDTSATENDATNAPGLYTFDVSATEANADWLEFSAKSVTANIKIIPKTVFTRSPDALRVPTGPTTVYVGKGGSDSNDGLSWTNRKVTIAGATPGTVGGGLAAASIANTPTHIFVGGSTTAYTEVNAIKLRSTATGNLGINLTLSPTVRIQGKALGTTTVAFTPDSLTWAGGTATLTITNAELANYLWIAGQTIAVTGAAQSGYNTTYTYAGATTATVSISDPGAATATGTLVATKTVPTAQRGCIISYGNGSLIEAYGALVEQTGGQNGDGSGVYQQCIGQNSAYDSGAQRARVRGGQYWGDTDCFFDTYQHTGTDSPDGYHQHVIIEDAAFVGKWDAVVIRIQGQRVQLRNCFISVTGPGSIDDGITDARCVAVDGGRMELYGCTIQATNGLTLTYGVYAASNNTEVELHNCSIQTSSGTGTVSDIHCATLATVRIYNSQYDASKAVGAGTITVVPSHGVNAIQISSDTTAADNLELQFDGTGLTGNTFPATQLALTTVDDFLDTEVAAIKAKTDQLSSFDFITAGTRFLTAIELDGAVYRYTTNALEQGPGGSGATQASVDEISRKVASMQRT